MGEERYWYIVLLRMLFFVMFKRGISEIIFLSIQECINVSINRTEFYNLL